MYMCACQRCRSLTQRSCRQPATSQERHTLRSDLPRLFASILEDGGEAEDPHGQRETQQEHHAERKRSQDEGEPFQREASMTSAQIGVTFTQLEEKEEEEDGDVQSVQMCDTCTEMLPLKWM